MITPFLLQAWLEHRQSLGHSLLHTLCNKVRLFADSVEPEESRLYRITCLWQIDSDANRCVLNRFLAHAGLQHRRQNAATTQLVGVDSHFLIVFGLGGVTILQGSGGRHIIFGGLIEKFLDERGFATTFFTDKDQSLRIRSGSESYTQEVKKGLGEYLAAN